MLWYTPLTVYWKCIAWNSFNTCYRSSSSPNKASFTDSIKRVAGSCPWKLRKKKFHSTSFVLEINTAWNTLAVNIANLDQPFGVQKVLTEIPLTCLISASLRWLGPSCERALSRCISSKAWLFSRRPIRKDGRWEVRKSREHSDFWNKNEVKACKNTFIYIWGQKTTSNTFCHYHVICVHPLQS